MLPGGCSSLGFSLGSAEPQAKALHAVGRLKEENNVSCCTGLGRAHVLPWAGCQRGQGLPASLPASSRGSWHTAWSPRGTHCWQTRVHSQRQRRAHPDSLPLGGDLAAHQLVCRTLPSHHNRCTKTPRRDKCHGSHQVPQEPHHRPPPGKRCPQRH